MATPSPSPSPPPPPPPPQSPSNPKPVSMKKPQPVPWTHQETIHLIQAYQDKWYSLKRGQLKASQWEEVAVTVAAKCGYDDYSNPSAKSAIQCRHKMEKLRKRYRTEKQGGATTSWQYFHLMDCLDRGPLPISSRPIMDDDVDGNDNDNDNDDNDNDDEEEEEEEENYIKSRSINYILRRPTFVNRFSGIMRGGSVKRPRIAVEEEEVGGGEEERGERERGRKVGMELAAEIRGFAERFVGMEKRKIEMMRETERCRMEMENKRIKMIMDSQRKIVDMIDMAFGNKIKVEQES